MAFEHLMVNPTDAEFVQLLREGVAAAKGSLAVADEQKLVERLHTPEGDFEHRDSRTLCLAAAWWTDLANRKHVRVTSRAARSDDELEETPDNLPPVCGVYPGSLLRVRKDDGEPILLAVCGCGALGTPEAIAWMGETCGPCADAKMEGKRTPPPLVQCDFRGEYLKVTPDGRGLIATNEKNRLVHLDLTTGERTVSDPVQSQALRGLTFAPDGESCLAGYWSNHLVRWNWKSNKLTHHGDPLVFSQFHVSPDNRHAITGESSTLLRIDWTAKEPLKPVTTWMNTRHGGFTRDGTKWVCLTEDHEFVELDFQKQRRRVLREEVFDGIEVDGGDDEWFYETLNVQQLDADSGWVIVALDDPEHGTQGPARLGHVSMPSDWRDLPYDDMGDTDYNMPHVFGFTPTGDYALFCDEDGCLVFFPTEEEGTATYRIEFLLPGTAWQGGSSALTFSPDGRMLYALTPALRYGLLIAFPWQQVLAAADDLL